MTWPYLGLPLPPPSSNCSMISGFGATLISESPMRPASSAACELDRFVWQIEDAQVLDRVVLAAMRLIVALPEQTHDLDGFLEHL